jgi:hypothetical protein
LAAPPGEKPAMFLIIFVPEIESIDFEYVEKDVIV